MSADPSAQVLEDTTAGENSRTILNLFVLHRHSFRRIEATTYRRISFHYIPIALVNCLRERQYNDAVALVLLSLGPTFPLASVPRPHFLWKLY